MNVLAFDTSTKLLTVELSCPAGRLYAVRDYGLRHSENLMEIISQLLTDGGIQPEELDLVACGRGPGSFTGLRIGMATVKGLSAALECPFVTVPTLDIFARGLDFFPGTVVSIVDAKKHRVYAAVFEAGRRISADLDISREDLFSLLSEKEQILLCGPDADLVAGGNENPGVHVIPFHSRGNPGALTALSLKEFQERGAASPDASPVYIRKSEAELSIKRKEGDAAQR